jgi:hypothetical protein
MVKTLEIKVIWAVGEKALALVNRVAESADTLDIVIIIKAITRVTTWLFQSTRKFSREIHLFGEEARYKMFFFSSSCEVIAISTWILAFISSPLTGHAAETVAHFKWPSLLWLSFRHDRQFWRLWRIYAIHSYLAHQCKKEQWSEHMRVPCVEILELHNTNTNTINKLIMCLASHLHLSGNNNNYYYN